MHEAEQYLRNPAKPNYIYVRYDGKKRKLFYNSDLDAVGIICPRSSKRGNYFHDWANIKKVYYPEDAHIVAERKRLRLITKYKQEASKATFTNPFIRKCMTADLSKGLYENGLTTGNSIDGEVITLDAIAKHAPSEVANFCKALAEMKEYNSCRFNFRGYDGSLSITVIKEDTDYYKKGDIAGYFNKEYRGTGNGYYYLLINNDKFIGYDVD